MTTALTTRVSVSSPITGSDPSPGRRSRRLHLAGLLLVLPVCAIAQPLPTGHDVTSGDVTVTTPGTTNMTITQGTNTATVDWQSFSIDQGYRVDILQPDQQSAILNRVTGDTTSQIHGQLNANGQVFVVNPNGIFIGPSGRVQTGGFVASTLDISNDDFNRGELRFRGLGNSAAVANHGVIETVPGGYAALIGGKVSNTGVIRVPMGRVGLGAGELVTLDIAGDGFLQVALPSNSDDDATEALIENSGLIEAHGGRVELMAATARNAARQAVNMSGIVEARSVGGRSGAIVLGGGDGGTVNITGRLDASATLVDSSPRPEARPATGGDITVTARAINLDGATLDVSGADGGGTIRVGGDFAGAGDLARADTVSADADTRLIADATGNGNGGRIVVWSDILTDYHGSNSARGGATGGDGGFVEISSRADLIYRGRTDTRAPEGQGGMLLLDPTDFIIDDASTINSDLTTTSVTLDTNAPGPDVGNIIINDDITWTSPFSFNLIAVNNIALNAAITGTSGTFSLSAGGTITTDANGAVDVDLFSLTAGTWRQVGPDNPAFNATDFRPSSDATFIRAIGGTGGAGDPFQLTDAFGLQGVHSTALATSNFVLANDIEAGITSGWRDFGEGTAGFQTIESFGGRFDGGRFTIRGLTKSDSTAGGLFNTLTASAVVTDLRIEGASVSALSGGILAGTNAGLIANTSVGGSISTFDGNTGGMVGDNAGTITDSFSTASVDVSIFDTELVHRVGGLVGSNGGAINRSNASGDVTADYFDFGGEFDGQIDAGGLVGGNLAGGTVSNSHAHGGISVGVDGADANVGGLAGFNQIGATIANSFSTGTPSGSGDGGINTGGLLGDNNDTSGGSGTVTASFWDVTTSGQSFSAGGAGLTTAQLQDTQGFFETASLLGWNFLTDWAPGEPGFYPANYTTEAVIFAQPDDFTVQYGLTDDASTTGPVAGGGDVFVFGPLGDSTDTSGLLGNLDIDVEDVGTSDFTLADTSLTSSLGQAFRVLSTIASVTITPAPLTIVALNQVKLEGEEFDFSGDEFEVIGELFEGDSVSFANLFSEGADEDATALGSPYPIVFVNGEGGAVFGEGLFNYDITLVNGLFTVLGESTFPPPPPPPPSIGGPPNPRDEITGGPEILIGVGIGVVGGAEETLEQTKEIATNLELAAQNCSQNGQDVGRYLDCLADALDSFANELDAIADDLPPGLENVGDILQGARAEVQAAATRAQARLASATTAAERQQIRREAVGAAQVALNNAAAEIRKSITLIRAEDPELVSLQTETIDTIALAVEDVSIGLSRVVEL